MKKNIFFLATLLFFSSCVEAPTPYSDKVIRTGDYALEVCAVIICVLLAIFIMVVWYKLNAIHNDMNKHFALISQQNSTAIQMNIKKESPGNKKINPQAKFKVGQLVIIKENENQFRITSISETENSTKYYSDKFKANYSENEIEDFDEYWKAKKQS